MNPMTQCPFHEHVALGAYGELEPDEQRVLDRHLTTCSSCRTLARTLNAPPFSTRDRSSSTPSAAWRAELARRTRPARGPRRRIAEWTLAFAAGVLCTFTITRLYNAPRPAPDLVQHAEVEPRSFARDTAPPRARGRTRWVRLAEVWERR